MSVTTLPVVGHFYTLTAHCGVVFIEIGAARLRLVTRAFPGRVFRLLPVRRRTPPGLGPDSR